MKRILLVDDEVPFLMSVADGLAVFEALEIITATNGAEAVKVLQNDDIDLVITDIQMPKMDGFELLAYLTKHHIGMPVIVISAFTTPQMRGELKEKGALVCLDKPIDFDELADRIFKVLLEHSADSIRGISVVSFVQLLSMERKTCCLRVKKEGKVGYLVMREGDLIHARVGKLTGDSAAFEIIGWGDAQIDMESRIPAVANDITRGLSFVIMEGLRLADESGRGETRSQKLMQSDASEGSVRSFRFNFVENEEAPKSTRIALTNAERSSVVKGKQRAWSQQSEPTTDQSMELSESGSTTGPQVNHGSGEAVINMQKLQVGMDNMKNTLGEGLVAHEVYDPEGLPHHGFGATQESPGVMLEVTRQIQKQLEVAGFGKLGRYYVIELSDNLLIGVIVTGGYTWAALIDLNKVNMGVFVTVAIPKGIKDLQAALAG